MVRMPIGNSSKKGNGDVASGDVYHRTLPDDKQSTYIIEVAPNESTKPEDATPCPTNQLRLWRKITYGFGGPPMQMLTNCIGFFLVIFLLETAGLNPYYNSVIQLTARVWDAISDPIVGYLVSKTHTRCGRFRPWLICSAPFGAVSFILLFYVPPIVSMPARFVYYLLTILMLQTAVTAFHVPYSSMTMVLTTNSRDRDSCSMYRMFFELTGVLIGAGVFGSIMSAYRITPDMQKSLNLTNLTTMDSGDPFSLPNLAHLSNLSLTNETANVLNTWMKWKENERYGYMLASSVIGALFILCAGIVFFGTREYDVDVQKREQYLRSLRRILTFRPYLLLMFGFLFISLGIQTVQGNLTMYVSHSLKLNNHITSGIMTLLLCAILCMPLVYKFSVRFGKKTTFRLGLANFYPIAIVMTVIPQNPPVWAFYLCMIWAAPTISVAFLMPWSMLPDVIDAFMVKTGMRRESAFYSLYVFFNKFAVGFSVAFSSIVLGLNGYRERDKMQPESVGLALRYLIGASVFICFTVSFIFIHFYPLDSERVKQNQLELTRLRTATNSQNSLRMDRSCTSLIRSSSTNQNLMPVNGSQCAYDLDHVRNLANGFAVTNNNNSLVLDGAGNEAVEVDDDEEERVKFYMGGGGLLGKTHPPANGQAPVNHGPPYPAHPPPDYHNSVQSHHTNTTSL